eukprot:GDKJ01002251.1.p1 GENE.GDKJ01002251.1~~GDKJ01002251.1.p1  ORF type:complete len:152 (+),score=32.26 GDKJ01002251.1:42-497(+)
MLKNRLGNISRDSLPFFSVSFRVSSNSIRHFNSFSKGNIIDALLRNPSSKLLLIEPTLVMAFREWNLNKKRSNIMDGDDFLRVYNIICKNVSNVVFVEKIIPIIANYAFHVPSVILLELLSEKYHSKLTQFTFNVIFSELMTRLPSLSVSQ